MTRFFAAGLAALVAAECLSGKSLPSARPPPLPVRDPAPQARVDPGWSDTLVSRPLFAPDRRPTVLAAPDAPVDATGAVKLTGVIVSQAGRSAIFVLDGAARPIVVHEGDRVGTVLVTTIEPGLVAVSSPRGDAVWHVGLGSFTPPPPEPPPPTEDERHTRGTDGQHAE